MKVVNASEMQALDRAAIAGGTLSLELMERAGRGVAESIARAVDITRGPIAVVCGAGNNGGDGFVVARHLAARGARVVVYLAAPPEKLSPDARANFTALGDYPYALHDISLPSLLGEHRSAISGSAVIVDALFGTGLTRALSAHHCDVVRTMNVCAGLHVAVDIPSGLDATTGVTHGAVFEAALTVTFAFPKVALVSHPGFVHVGRLEVVDIGIPEALADAQRVKLELVEGKHVRAALPKRPLWGHKGTFGHVLVVAGSRDKPGAALLCAEGVLRVGAGLCTIASTAAGQNAMGAHLPEAMTACYAQSDEPAATDLTRLLELAANKTCVVIGPGIPTGNGMRDIVLGLIRQLEIPIVLDADGLNLIAPNVGLLRDRRASLALTPHPGEMARLCGGSMAEIQADRVGNARRLAADTGACVALKGARTVTAAPDGRAWINPTGNPGMGTAGTGDVLAGMVGGLIGQGLGTAESLWVAAYVHGEAGDKAAVRRGQRGLLSRDLLCEIPSVFRDYECNV